jgi:hypothetical protein
MYPWTGTHVSDTEDYCSRSTSANYWECKGECEYQCYEDDD